MTLEGDYVNARWNVLRLAHRVIGHEFDPAEDPGWQAELDDEQFDDAVCELAAAINAKKQAVKEQ